MATLDEDQAADLKDDLASHVQFAVGFTTATGVARNLKITKAKLDSAYQAARKADLLAKLDQAVKNNRITADQAAQAEGQARRGRSTQATSRCSGTAAGSSAACSA